VTDSRLLDDLSRPGSYPAPQPAVIERRDTHISWVFLAGDAAWKIKRPVQLPFLDFRSLDRRRHFCEEELRLNRRLAPGIYQEVVPVRRGPTGCTLEPAPTAGPVVDYAVKMRRLPDDSSAAALLAAGRLTAGHLSALATRLAAFYGQVPARPDLGGPAAMATNVEENLSQLEAAGDHLDRERLAAVAAAQRRDLQRHHHHLSERQASGQVRDGHGDLRLEHVYFVPEPVVIDCVEFSERFRVGDVALDIAFLVMELRAAGRTDLAEYFVHRFARETNDYELYPLLDFYCAYRALVRAKIACLLAGDTAVPAEKRRRKAAEAKHLLALTQALESGSPDRPTVVAVGGQVATGKSSLAEAISQVVGLPVISSDLTRKWLAGLRPTDRGGPALYTADFTDRTYGELIRRAGLVLDGGRSVILDATFRDPARRRLARDLAAARDARFLFVETACDEATVRARLRARASGPTESDADEQVLDQLREQFVPADELHADERLQVVSTRPLPALVDDVRARLTQPGG
jgi:uncharacterized protein